MAITFEEIAEQKSSSSEEGEKETISFEEILQEKSGQAQDPLSFGGSAKSFGSGVAGGTGGPIQDILSVIPGKKAKEYLSYIDKLFPKGTQELAHDLYEPKNASERILQQSGEFAGLEGLLGTLGGPASAGLGAAHGAVSGGVYGSLKEMGFDDPWALGLTFGMTLSPIAFKKLLPRLKKSFQKGKNFKEALKETGAFTEEEIATVSKGSEGQPPPPPGSGPPPPGSGPSAPASGSFEEGKSTFASLVPEDELLDTLVPLFEEAMESKKTPRPSGESSFLEFKMPKPKHNPIVLEEEIGKVISDTRIPNTTTASKSIRNEINRLATEEYKNVNKMYATSKSLNKGISDIHPTMSNKLAKLIDEINLSAEPANIQKDIRKIANSMRMKAGSAEKGYRPISNNEIISQIQSNNKKVNHDYAHGRSSNAYLELNNILQDAVTSSIKDSPKAVEAWNSARKGYREWQSKFGSSDISPWTNPSNSSNSKLFKSMENPDQIQVLENIIGKTEKGRHLIDATKRDFIEKKMRPFTKDLSKIESAEYVEQLKELQPITTLDQRMRIDSLMEKSKAPIDAFDKGLANYTEAKKAHALGQKRLKEEFASIKSEMEKISRNFPYKTDSSIMKDLTSVRGLKRIESTLPKTKDGKKAVKQIKDYTAAKLLSEGKLIPSDKATPLFDILNDTNKRKLLEYTLGKEKTNKLARIVNDSRNIDKEMSKVKRFLLKAKTAGKLTPGIGSTISKGEAVYDIWRMFKPAIEKAEYGTVSPDVIKKILESDL